MEFYALVEEWPDESWVVFRELPGCFSTAPTTQEAVQKAPEAIAEYLRWLKQNNILMLEEEVNSINVVVKERLRGDQVVPRFEADLPAPTDREIDTALGVARAARAQLTELYNDVLPAHRSSALQPDEWSLTEHLRHILVTEARYIAYLSDQPPEAMPAVAEADLTRKLLENAMDYEGFLRELTPEQRTRVYVHGEAEWTAAKVLRLMIGHLREHYPWMRAIARQFSPRSLTGPGAEGFAGAP